MRIVYNDAAHTWLLIKLFELGNGAVHLISKLEPEASKLSGKYFESGFSNII